ncbi:macrophage mannose receptor 1-like [Sceloporus undulatus]|uniref:macrophage mannose receptor 1-like n=1 Tax=Sceloporus undulatus TaxID=8520 RepID=UPI001C4D0859|nr:macrophage mannose receptor 1-like [Sceloporus undulatus]
MFAFLLLNFLFLIQPTSQVSEPDTFLIHNEYLNLCIQPQKSRSIILESCNMDNEWQNFKWASEDQILNMATKLCLAVPSNASLVQLTLSPCNKTSELQKWACRNETLLALGEENLFLQPARGRKGNIILSKIPTTKSNWKIYGTKDSLCSKGYEALFTLEGNSLGAPCVFPFKYMNKWHAKCITDDDENARLWCGTTADVNENSLTGYCPVKDDHDEFFWTKNHWTGDLYQINSLSALTWYQARRSCQQQNAELLNIRELHEQTYLTGLTGGMDGDYWIGLNNLDSDNGWKWAGNHPFPYLNWAPGSPSPESEKICGSMQSKNGNWVNYKCDQRLGYICKKENSSLDSSVIPADDLKPIKCQDGWIAYTGYCYCLHREPKTWSDALLSCRKADGDLISIHNIEEYSFVISQLGYKTTDLLWIGLNDRKTQMYFEWSDGTPVRFTKWQRGEPTHIKNIQEDCVIMSGENGSWGDSYCEDEFGYICKRKPLSSVPEEAEPDDPKCQKGWKKHGLYCYFIGVTVVTFSEAKIFCEANKGFLTTVEDRYEQAYLTSLVGLRTESYFWIGLSDVQHPGTFRWTNGDNILFTHWNSDMPGQRPGCVAMRTGTAAGLWDVVDCEEKATVLCKRWAEGVTPPPVPATTTQAPCPEGWSSSPTRNVCFKVFLYEKRKKKSWLEARDFCRAIGGDLVSIHSYEENLLLKRLMLSEGAWLGLNRLDPEKGWTWSDGSPLDFEDAHENSSPYLNTQPTCKSLYRYYSKWRTSSCEFLINWICQITKGVSLKPEPRDTFDYSFKIVEDGWIEYGSNEYYFSNATLPAERAQAFCKKHGGGLTVIETERERKFLWKYNYRYGAGYNAYIGLILSLDGKFGWMDGSPVTYVSWAPNEPNFANDDENCVVMYSNTGLWNDINCGAENGFICKRHNSSVDSPVTPTSPEPLGGCAEGWLLFDNKCFRIFGFNEGERRNWSDARTECKNLGGNLASITSQAVQAFLIVHIKSTSTDPWIGLNDINQEHHFLWTDGSGVYYTNWAKGSPRYNGDCVSMVKKPEMLVGNWRDERCRTKKSYICQKKTDTILSQHETTLPAAEYTLYGNSSYSLVSPKMTWEDARKKCKSENSELASILNPYTQSFLWLLVLKYKEPVWIGLNSNLTDEKYKWISNWRLMYTNWAAEEPKKKIACVYLDLDGHWKTGTCNETYFSVCEKYHGIIPTDPPEGPGRCPESKVYHRSWIPFRAHCYAIYPMRVAWSRASMLCAHLGGTLTSIEDLAEMNFLLIHTQEFTETEFWIGLFKNVDGEWIWQDNTEVDFMNWKYEVPRTFFTPYEHDGHRVTFREQCISMNSQNGKWIGEGCNYPEKGFICKTSKIPEEPTKKPTEEKQQAKVPASAHGTIVIVGLLVMLILISAGITAYIFSKRRRRQLQTTAGFGNSLYQDNVVILQNDSDSLADNKTED